MKKILLIAFIRLYSIDTIEKTYHPIINFFKYALNNSSKNMLHFFNNTFNTITNKLTRGFNQCIDKVKQEGLWQLLKRNKIPIASSVILAVGLYQGMQAYNKKPQNATLINEKFKDQLQKHFASLNKNNGFGSHPAHHSINDVHNTAHEHAIEYIKTTYHTELKKLFDSYDETKKKLASTSKNIFSANVMQELTEQDKQANNIEEAVNRKGQEYNAEYNEIINKKYTPTKTALIDQLANITKQDIVTIKTKLTFLSMSDLHTLYNSYFQTFEKAEDFNSKKFYTIFEHTSKESKMKRENKFLNAEIVTIYNQEYNRQYFKVFYTRCKEHEGQYNFLAKYSDVL